MKKVIFVLAVLSLSSLALAEKNVIEIRGGYDLSSRTKFKDGDDSDSKKFVKNGFHLGAEYRREILTNFQIGAGLEYRLSKLDQPSDYSAKGLYYTFSDTYNYGDLTSVPLYITARYNFKNSTEFTPYVKANLGYAINSGKVDGITKYTNFSGVDTDVRDYKRKLKNGMFYGIGTGVEYKNFLVDLSYDITYSKLDTQAYIYDGYYNTTTQENFESKFNTQKLKNLFY